MPDQNVFVSFNAPSSWNIRPPLVTLSAAGKIVFHRDPPTAAWAFVSVNVVDGGPQFSNEPGGGDVFKVDDAVTNAGTYEYTVTVRDGNGNHVSPLNDITQTPPPRIQNTM